MSVGYWYISFKDAPTQFFRDEEMLTEAQWRAEAPPHQVAELDAEHSLGKLELFPKDVAAS